MYSTCVSSKLCEFISIPSFRDRAIFQRVWATTRQWYTIFTDCQSVTQPDIRFLVNATPSLPPGLPLLFMHFHHMNPQNRTKDGEIIRRYMDLQFSFSLLKFKAWPWLDWDWFQWVELGRSVDPGSLLLSQGHTNLLGSPNDAAYFLRQRSICSAKNITQNSFQIHKAYYF